MPVSKSIRASIIASVACLGLAATAAAQDEGPIRIGLVAPLSGPVSMFGVPQQQTIEMYADEINDNGGLLGRQIEIVAYDDEGNPSNAATFVTRLIESDDVDLILGPSTTGTTMAVVWASD